MRTRWLIVALTALALLPALRPRTLRADDPADESLRQQVAARLVAATATLRIQSPLADRAEGPLSATPQITVCSAVSVGEGLFVTFAAAPAGARLRLTLADGEQASARLAATDRYSGLSLLETDARGVTAIEPAAEMPLAGATLLTASAAGLDQPVVSQGILGGADRTLPGSGLPPLLQCDVRTTDTSSGGAVVDRQGRLVGIVAATPDRAAGWTYAVPVRHVERLLRARVADQVVVLQPQRPTVGFTLGPGDAEGTVRVERVTPEGPAAKAGVEQNDLVLEADGRKVRSAYQVVDLVLRKQPGDTVDLLVRRGDRQQPLRLTLEGGVVFDPPRDGLPLAGVRIGPQLNVRAVGPNTFEVRSPPASIATVQEVAAGAADAVPRAERVPRDELTMLRAQLAAFEKVIEHLQAELQRHQQRELELEARLKALDKQP